MTTKANATTMRKIAIILACNIIAFICLTISIPVIYGGLNYWGINQSIKEAEVLAEQLVERGQRRDDVDREISLLKTKREDMATKNHVVKWCLMNSKNDLARYTRNYTIVSYIFRFLLGITLIGYEIYQLITSIIMVMRYKLSQKADRKLYIVFEEKQEFNGKDFMNNLEEIQQHIARTL